MSGISDAVTISGRLVKLAKTTMTLEAQEQIVELRAAVLDAQEEILHLREELGELKRAAAERAHLKFDGKVYWRELPDAEKEGPFCPRCHDANEKVIHLHETPRQMPCRWQCSSCSKYFDYR